MINLRIYLIFLINFIVFAYIDEFYPSHPMLKEFSFHINNCKENSKYCDDNYHDIALVAAKLSNEHAALLLLDRAQAIFMDAFYYIFPESILGNKLTHMIAILAFAQGDILTVLIYHSVTKCRFNELFFECRLKNIGKNININFSMVILL